MKKLMIALAAVALAGAAQATQWTFSGTVNSPIKDGYKATTVGGTSSGSLGAGYSAYVISYSDGTSGYAAYGTTQSAFLANLRSGKSVSEAAGTALIGNTTTTADSIIDTFTVDLDANFYLVLDRKDEDLDRVQVFLAVVAGDDVYMSVVSPGQRYNPNFCFWANYSDTRMDVDGTAAYSSAGWYAISVPEPTSGLLMLLGMAGLALRRKRA